jgi:octaprenyl-diphosphate synthase
MKTSISGLPGSYFLSRRNAEANPLTDRFSEYLAKVDEALRRELALYSWSEFHAPLRYASDGGKRIRPLVLILSAESFGGEVRDDAYLAASAIELLHTESIIHDDIIDEEKLRRGKPSFHVKYGYNSSILTADFVLGIILNIGSKLHDSGIISELANAATRMSEGEMTEIKLTKSTDLTEEDYIQVLQFKTASLFEASAKIGAMLGLGSSDQIKAMSSFGNLLGIAYQIHDDLMDWNNENRLFSMLVKNANGKSKDFVARMDRLYRSYAEKAKGELTKLGIANASAIHHLEHLTDLESVQF